MKTAGVLTSAATLLITLSSITTALPTPGQLQNTNLAAREPYIIKPTPDGSVQTRSDTHLQTREPFLPLIFGGLRALSTASSMSHHEKRELERREPFGWLGGISALFKIGKKAGAKHGVEGAKQANEANNQHQQQGHKREAEPEAEPDVSNQVQKRQPFLGKIFRGIFGKRDLETREPEPAQQLEARAPFLGKIFRGIFGKRDLETREPEAEPAQLQTRTPFLGKIFRGIFGKREVEARQPGHGHGHGGAHFAKEAGKEAGKEGVNQAINGNKVRDVVVEAREAGKEGKGEFGARDVEAREAEPEAFVEAADPATAAIAFKSKVSREAVRD